MKLIPLTRGKSAIVDDSDFERVNQFKWNAHFDPRGNRYYARRWFRNPKTGKRKTVCMHQFILQHSSPRTDHKNGDGLDNRRTNIRPCSAIQNGRNRKLQKHSSKFKGVAFFPPNGTWVAYVRLNNKKVHLGYFDTEREAALAYDTAATAFYGEFVRTNKQMGVL